MHYIGICDSLVTSILRAWDYNVTKAQINHQIQNQNHNQNDNDNTNNTTNLRLRLNYGLLIAPAMNTSMYNHPTTQPAIHTICSWNKNSSGCGSENECGFGNNVDTTNFNNTINTNINNTNTTNTNTNTTNTNSISRLEIIEPISKLLACGDIGIGAMASVDTICNKTLELKVELLQLCDEIQFNLICEPFILPLINTNSSTNTKTSTKTSNSGSNSIDTLNPNPVPTTANITNTTNTTITNTKPINNWLYLWNWNCYCYCYWNKLLISIPISIPTALNPWIYPTVLTSMGFIMGLCVGLSVGMEDIVDILDDIDINSIRL